MVSPVGTFFIVLFVLVIAAAVGWIVFTQLRARRLGLPAPPLSSYIPFARRSPEASYGPQPAPGGIKGWISDKWRAWRSTGNRSAAGAYERPSRRGFGALDPDEAWDARVGHEADAYYGYGYEEQELGVRGTGQGGQQQHGQQRQQYEYRQHQYGQQSQDPVYGGNGGYSNVNLGADEQRGRTPSRDLGLGSTGGGRNPFDDDAAEPSNISLRGVSPRPIDTSVGGMAKAKGVQSVQGGQGQTHESPTTSERRSIFRENV
ncbi:hypothetical protein F4821DRAFT_227013 [Hypoxylon rubiginosum]|uniref:Uncharacterized protein n=1 Tax=Hypoxylon rubiginosum TaxID=110542 RepID=A0ACC0DEU2_9PEZI|nr:hypothetical protein F4821DRAFT_227013 [Hypoxylon rubiginosum]